MAWRVLLANAALNCKFLANHLVGQALRSARGHTDDTGREATFANPSRACTVVIATFDACRDLVTEGAATSQPLPPAYHALFRWWFAFGFPAFFTSVLAIFWLMIAKPQPWSAAPITNPAKPTTLMPASSRSTH